MNKAEYTIASALLEHDVLEVWTNDDYTMIMGLVVLDGIPFVVLSDEENKIGKVRTYEHDMDRHSLAAFFDLHQCGIVGNIEPIDVPF